MRKKGPWTTTRVLLEAVKGSGIAGASLLDIGGGVGAIQHDLLKSGASTATSVDVSGAYIAAARSEAERQGLAFVTPQSSQCVTASGGLRLVGPNRCPSG